MLRFAGSDLWLAACGWRLGADLGDFDPDKGGERPEGAGEPPVPTRRTEVHGTPRAGRVGTPSWRKG